jgi:hypothetical protein
VTAQLPPDVRDREQNYRNALEQIRVIAVLHYIGAAFEPEHMRTLANIAADALDDRPIPAPPDPEEIAERAREWADKYGAWVE